MEAVKYWTVVMVQMPLEVLLKQQTRAAGKSGLCSVHSSAFSGESLLNIFMTTKF